MRIGAQSEAPDRNQTSITPDEVERATTSPGERIGWNDRTREKPQKYLKAATTNGNVQRKPLPEELLTTVDFGDLDATLTAAGLEYDRHEALLLFAPHESIQWRVALAASVAADAGRRIGAIRGLPCAYVSIGDRIWL